MKSLLWSYCAALVLFTGTRCFCQEAEFGDRALGWLSEGEESKSAGSASVSTGRGDPGGVSYGIYQLSSTRGTAKAFVDRYYAKQFVGLTAGTPEFTKKWIELARQDEDGFAYDQYLFIKKGHYDPLVKAIRERYEIDITARSLALRNVVFSTAVQHGPQSQVVSRAIEGLSRTPTSANGDEEIINAIYKQRGKRDEKTGVLAYFVNSDEQVQKSVARRLRRENTTALCMLAFERFRKEQANKGAESVKGAGE